jgi:hypothetical protein
MATGENEGIHPATTMSVLSRARRTSAIGKLGEVPIPMTLEACAKHKCLVPWTADSRITPDLTNKLQLNP